MRDHNCPPGASRHEAVRNRKRQPIEAERTRRARLGRAPPLRPSTRAGSVKWTRVASLLLLAYGFLFALSGLIHWLLFDQARIELRPVTDRWMFVASITLSAAVFIFVVDTAIGGRLPRPNPRRLVTFMAAMLFWGIAVEIVLDWAAVTFIGRKAWEYQVWPRHDGYTSGVAAFMWPLYGAHLCFFEDALRVRGLLPRTRLLRSMLAGFDAMTMEIICNLWAIVAFGTYYFYYLAPDLKHFTAGEIFVPYVLANLALAATVQAVERSGRRWWIWCVGFCVVALVALFFPWRLAP